MKIDDQEFGRDVPQSVKDFKDATLEVVNNGKFQFQFVSSSSAPTFAGRNGECTFINNGTDGRLYVFRGSAWNLVALFTVDAS